MATVATPVAQSIVTINGGKSAIAHILTLPPGSKRPGSGGMGRGGKPGQTLRLACQPCLQSTPGAIRSPAGSTPGRPGMPNGSNGQSNKPIVSRYSFPDPGQGPVCAGRRRLRDAHSKRPAVRPDGERPEVLGWPEPTERQ